MARANPGPMEQSTAQRRLVKSPPELWAEVSSEDALGRHLSEFGEIRITRVEPETTVAWEGDRASGTVKLAPAGWGTKVILTATPAEQLQDAPPAHADEPPAVAAEPVAQAAVQPEPPASARPVQEAPAARRGFFARLFRRRAKPPEPAEAPAPVAAGHDPGPPAPGLGPPPPGPDPAPTPTAALAPPEVCPAPTLDPVRTAAILTEVLDDLGADHHRPFSRD